MVRAQQSEGTGFFSQSLKECKLWMSNIQLGLREEIIHTNTAIRLQTSACSMHWEYCTNTVPVF